MFRRVRPLTPVAASVRLTKVKCLSFSKNVHIVAIIFFLLDHYGTLDFRFDVTCVLDFDAAQILCR